MQCLPKQISWNTSFWWNISDSRIQVECLWWCRLEDDWLDSVRLRNEGKVHWYLFQTPNHCLSIRRGRWSNRPKGWERVDIRKSILTDNETIIYFLNKEIRLLYNHHDQVSDRTSQRSSRSGYKSILRIWQFPHIKPCPNFPRASRIYARIRGIPYYAWLTTTITFGILANIASASE